MVGVVIIAVLATVAVVSMKKYSQRARTQEAINFLLGIKTKQETYFLTYKHYASTNNLYPVNPLLRQIGKPNHGILIVPGEVRMKARCARASRPDSLGACSGDVTCFGKMFVTSILVMGWAPGSSPSPTYINEPNRQWWYAIAKGDLDQDGTHQSGSSSETLEVYNKAGDDI